MRENASHAQGAGSRVHKLSRANRNPHRYISIFGPRSIATMLLGAKLSVVLVEIPGRSEMIADSPQRKALSAHFPLSIKLL